MAWWPTSKQILRGHRRGGPAQANMEPHGSAVCTAVAQHLWNTKTSLLLAEGWKIVQLCALPAYLYMLCEP